MTSRREMSDPGPEYLDAPDLPWCTVPSCLPLIWVSWLIR